MEIVRALTILRYEVWFFTGGLALIVGFRLLTGRVNIKGLLNDQSGASSPARLQLLLITLAGAVYYAALCYQKKTFAAVPDQLVAVLGGSNAFYVVRKFLGLPAVDGS